MDIFKIDLKERQKNNVLFRFNTTQISLINTEFQRRKVIYDNIKTYYIGKNKKITNKTTVLKEVLNHKMPMPYGRLLATTTIGYMLKKDPEILIKNNDKQQESIQYQLLRAGGYNALKDALANTIIYGVGYTLAFQTQEDNKIMAKIQSLHPSECIAVYDYDIIPNLIAVVRKYTLNNSLKQITEYYYKDAIVIYENNTLKTEIKHSAGCVPVSVCFANNEMIGVIEPVIPLIDALDEVANSDLDEIQKFSLAIMIAYGISIDDDTLEKVKAGALLEVSSIDASSRIEYLTREVNDTYRGDIKAFLVDKIHKLSQVPDFADPNFSALSGVALKYKLLGFDNLCGELEIRMIESIKQTLYLIDKINNLGTSTIDKYNLWITMTGNLPNDDNYKLQNATLMKNMGLSKETYLGYISDYIDDVAKEIDRQEKETENMSLFPNGNYDMNADDTDEEQQQQDKGNN